MGFLPNSRQGSAAATSRCPGSRTVEQTAFGERAAAAGRQGHNTDWSIHHFRSSFLATPPPHSINEPALHGPFVGRYPILLRFIPAMVKRRDALPRDRGSPPGPARRANNPMGDHAIRSPPPRPQKPDDQSIIRVRVFRCFARAIIHRARRVTLAPMTVTTGYRRIYRGPTP